MSSINLKLIVLFILSMFFLNSSAWDLRKNGPKTCGKHKMGFGTIIGGTRITRGQHPWVAVITEADGSLFCGGTLISSKMVITAAHCLKGKDNSHNFEPSDILVILGSYNLQRGHEPGKVTVSVFRIHIHPDWHINIASYDADIAMLELEADVTFTRYIQPACIASPQSVPASKTEGVVVGHGKSENNDFENIAKIVNTPIHNYGDCLKSEDHQSMLSHRTFCGGLADGTGVCSGDSGSGLIVNNGDIFYLRGIVSASLYGALNGCNVNQYSVFTDITKFYSWVMTGDDNGLTIGRTAKTISTTTKSGASLRAVDYENLDENTTYKSWGQLWKNTRPTIKAVIDNDY